MKRTVYAALAASMAMALTDAVFVMLAESVYNVHGDSFLFGSALLGLTPGFLALGLVYVLLTPPSPSRIPVALALLVVRLFVFDHLFIAPKRIELTNDAGKMRGASQPLPRNYYVAMGTVQKASLAAGLGCAAAGTLVVFGVGSRRRRRNHQADENEAAL